MSIYQEIILDHYKHPRNFGMLKKSDGVIDVSNPSCGDKIKLSAKIMNGIVKEIKFSGEGCAISIAAASLLTEKIKGKKLSDLRKLDRSFMLKLLGVELSPNRLKCALLSLEAAQKL